jgi:hypothetical protein
MISHSDLEFELGLDMGIKKPKPILGLAIYTGHDPCSRISKRTSNFATDSTWLAGLRFGPRTSTWN